MARILCTYGYRRPPFGERACLSDDGITWDPANEVIIRDDAPNGDLGYPASVELDSSRILTIYYQPDVPKGTVQRMHPPDPSREKPAILGTIWTKPAGKEKTRVAGLALRRLSVAMGMEPARDVGTSNVR